MRRPTRWLLIPGLLLLTGSFGSSLFQEAEAFCGSTARYARAISHGGGGAGAMPDELRQIFASVGISPQAFGSLPRHQQIELLKEVYTMGIESNLDGVGRGGGDYNHAISSTRDAIDAFSFPQRTHYVSSGLLLRIYSDQQLSNDFTNGGLYYPPGEVLTFQILATSENSSLIKLVYGRGQKDRRDFVGWVRYTF